MRKTTLSAGLVCTMLLGISAARSGEGDKLVLEPIFDGKTLEGWEQHGGKAKYHVEDGAVVGTSVPSTGNSFLCTKKLYGDFVLELEYMVDERLNSGVQVRSNVFGAPQEVVVGARGQKIPAGRVHGYQVEIDPDVKRGRLWSGGIYDEGRRGWLNDLSQNEAARKAFKPNEWNRYRVEAIGDRIRTWINGVPAADLVDPMTQKGFIGLQVHGIGRDENKIGAQVRWRDIRLADLGTSVWRPIFDGKSTAGWHTLPGGSWEVADGAIIGRSEASESRHGLLVTDREYEDFTVRVAFKVIKGNSGFYFRAKKVDHAYGVNGFQAEIEPGFTTGGLYETGGRAWVSQPNEDEVKKAYRPGEWNVMVVSAHGRRIVVHVNNVKISELRDDPGRTKGHLALQLHGGQEMHVEFKDIALLTRRE